ncbi:MAG: hypothetical protein ACYC3I_07995 [Gemmataceae bacterium]
MFDVINSLGEYLPYLKLAGVAIGIALAVFAAAALTYIIKVMCGPSWRVVQWLVGHTPGEQPGEFVQGMSYGARMLFWAGVIGIVGWTIFH